MARLDGARIKLDRANRHVDELRSAARVYLESRPFALIQSEEPNGDLVWRVRICRQVPREWSAVIGDAIHNLRSALDLLAWQLVESSSGQPTRDTCFPIGHGPPRAYEQQLQRSLAGASPAIHRFVRRLKPYTGGNAILSQLHALDIADKHRLILVVGAAHKHVVMKMKMAVPWDSTPVEFPPIAINPADRQFPLRDGAEVFAVRAAARKSDVTPEHQVVFELAFGEIDEVRGLPLVQTLQSMHRHVTKIVTISEEWFFR